MKKRKLHGSVIESIKSVKNWREKKKKKKKELQSILFVFLLQRIMEVTRKIRIKIHISLERYFSNLMIGKSVSFPPFVQSRWLSPGWKPVFQLHG